MQVHEEQQVRRREQASIDSHTQSRVPRVVLGPHFERRIARRMIFRGV
jgi:hypothetical protein